MTDPQRFDLDALEFRAVRELLNERLSTTLGRRLVERLAPLPSASAARAALGEAAELAAAGDVRPPVGGAVEVRSWLGGFFAGEHQPEVRDLADLKRLLRAAARCRAWLAARPGAPHLAAMAGRFPAVGDLADELERVVDDRGEVLSSASLRLAQIRDEIVDAEAAVRAAVARFVADERMRRVLQSPEPSWRHGRPVFAVRYEQRHQVAGVQHDRSQSGATVFVEPQAIVEVANRLADARGDEHREVQVVLTGVCRGLRRLRGEVEGAVEAMAGLDLAMARAALIERDGFRAVPIPEGATIRLRGALHPVLLQAAAARGASHDLVPLDLTLGDPHTMLVVTGPNTGGKTVALKTLGLLVCMAMAGVPVPAAEGTELPFLDGVFADIGDEQAISQNLSTFSSHLQRIVRCLHAATPRSLVLLDEVGAGTDPEEGGALGIAVLEELERRRVPAVVTTHLGRLKDFAYQHTGAENGAMAFDGATLQPLYRLDVGIPGASHALDIARRVGVPDQVVARAREVLGARDARLERMIEQVQVARRQAEDERRRTEVLKREAESVGREIEDRRRDIDRQRAWLDEEADALVDEQVRAIRSRLEGALRSLVNAPKPHGDEARRALDELARLTEGTSLRRRRLRFVSGLKRDGVVFLPRLGKRCTVRKVDRAREILTVEVGQMRLEVPFEDVSWVQPLDA
jgi:DNA mismatch repair protein MutS2